MNVHTYLSDIEVFSLVHYHCQGRSQGGAEGVRAPHGVFGPPWAEGPLEPKLRRKQPKPSQKSRNMYGNRPKSTSGQLGPVWQSGPPENQDPVTISGPSDSQSHHQWSFWILGPSQLSGPVNIRSPLSIKGPLLIRSPLTIRALQTVRGPLIIRGPSEHQEPFDHQCPSD